MPRFALLCYQGTDNIGDEIQSIAARRFLPSVDAYVDREKLNDFGQGDERFHIILNGWYCHNPETWPPSPKLIPLLTSMHFAPYPVGRAKLVPAKHLLQGANAEYLKAWGPVGTRDRNSLSLLTEAGIDAYFSGCMTLTLPRPDVEKEDYSAACDVDEEILWKIAGHSKRRIERVSHVGYEHLSREERFRKASELLSFYAKAKSVVTSRIHCALPCLAMGTPVLFIDVGNDGGRFWGLSELFQYRTISDIKEGRINYNIDSPPSNPLHFLPLREAMLYRVTKFVEDAVCGIPSPPFLVE